MTNDKSKEMKKLLNILIGFVLIMAIQSCSEELLVDKTIDETVAGGVLRSLEETNSLDIEEMSSTYTHLLEAQDEEGGDLLQEVIVNVGFTDDDEADTDDDGEIDDFAFSADPSEFTRIPASEFSLANSTSINNLPAATFTATLQQLVDHLGLADGDYDVGDVFNINFQMVLTDGRIFDSSNATSDITRTGVFSYFNAQFDYSPAIQDPQRVKLTDTSRAPDGEEFLRQGVVDTVIFKFDRDVFSVSDPVVTTRYQSTGVAPTDDNIGALTPWPTDDDRLDDTDFGDSDNVFFLLYTAGSIAQDTVTFIVSGATDVAGLPMATVEFEDAFVVDNTVPTASRGAANLTTAGSGASTVISEVSVEVSFTEAVSGDVTYTITSAQFDTITITQSADASTLETVVFEPATGGASISAGNISFTIAAQSSSTDGAEDVAGNLINSSFTVDLF